MGFDALNSLTFNNPHNLDLVAEADAIPVVVQAMRQHQSVGQRQILDGVPVKRAGWDARVVLDQKVGEVSGRVSRKSGGCCCEAIEWSFSSREDGYLRCSLISTGA